MTVKADTRAREMRKICVHSLSLQSCYPPPHTTFSSFFSVSKIIEISPDRRFSLFLDFLISFPLFLRELFLKIKKVEFMNETRGVWDPKDVDYDNENSFQ